MKDYDNRFNAEQAFNHKWIKTAEKNFDLQIADDVFENMKSFMDANKFKKTTLTYIAWKIPESSIEDLRNTFIKLDSNADGKITIDEFRTGINCLNIKATEEEISNLIKNLDSNNNGFVDYTEFLAGCLRSQVYL